MTPREAASILRQHNVWRRWDEDNPGPTMLDPTLIGEAMDIAAKYIEPEYDRSLIADMLTALHSGADDLYTIGAIMEQIRLLRAADNADAAKVRTVRRASGSAPDDIDTESADFKEGFAVGRAESEHLCEMIKDPACHRCGATSAKDAETKCRPGGMGGDECPGTEWPLSKLWATPPASAPEVTDVPEDDDGQPVGYADWYNARYFGQCVDTSRDHACESAWRAGYTAALQQEGKSHG